MNYIEKRKLLEAQANKPQVKLPPDADNLDCLEGGGTFCQTVSPPLRNALVSMNKTRQIDYNGTKFTIFNNSHIDVRSLYVVLRYKSPQELLKVVNPDDVKIIDGLTPCVSLDNGIFDAIKHSNLITTEKLKLIDFFYAQGNTTPKIILSEIIAEYDKALELAVGCGLTGKDSINAAIHAVKLTLGVDIWEVLGK